MGSFWSVATVVLVAIAVCLLVGIWYVGEMAGCLLIEIWWNEGLVSHVDTTDPTGQSVTHSTLQRSLQTFSLFVPFFF